MTIAVAEKFRGRAGDKLSGREIVYLATGSAGDLDLDETAALNAVTTVSPDDVDGLARTNASIIEHIGMSHMLIGVQYGAAGFEGAVITPAGTVEYEFNFQAESEHVYLSLGTRRYAAAGDTPLDFKGAINVRKVNGENVVEGLDLPAGNTTHVYSFTVATSTVTTAYEQLVESLMGTVNNVAFKNRAAGTTRFVSCSSNFVTGNKAVIRFGLQVKPNLTNLIVADGTIVVSQLFGHELLWGYFEDDLNEPVPNNFGVIKYPRYVYAEQVFREGNLNLLGF